MYREGRDRFVYAPLNENPNPTREQLKEQLSGNLCRCTGFVKIYEAAELREKSPVEPAPVEAR